MWAGLCGINAEEWADYMVGASRPEPEGPGSGRQRNYLCGSCGTHGRGLDDGSLTCWCCEKDDDLAFDKVPLMPSCHNAGTAAPGGFGQLEDVASLVG